MSQLCKHESSDHNVCHLRPSGGGIFDLQRDVGYELLRVSKAVLLMWIFYVFFLFFVSYTFVRVCLNVPCGHLLGMADFLALVCDVKL